MSTELCFEIYFSKFKVYEFIKENRDSIIKLSVLNEGEIEIKSLENENKLNFFICSRFLFKSTILINEIISDLKNNVRKFISLQTLYKHFSDVKIEIEMTIHEFKKLAEKVFIVDDKENVELESIITFYQKNYSLKVKVTDFLEISLNSIVSSYDFLERKIIMIFDQNDPRRNTIIKFKEFQTSITQILGVSENEWKINEYFQYIYVYKELL